MVAAAVVKFWLAGAAAPVSWPAVVGRRLFGLLKPFFVKLWPTEDTGAGHLIQMESAILPTNSFVVAGKNKLAWYR
jgi:hypothetical protein